MARVFLDQNKNVKAEEMIRKALHIIREILRHSFSDLTDLHKPLLQSLEDGLAMKEQGDSEKALQLFEQALGIYKDQCSFFYVVEMKMVFWKMALMRVLKPSRFVEEHLVTTILTRRGVWKRTGLCRIGANGGFLDNTVQSAN
ncbi:unnamed protein product [Cylindrotheca closterium]|uniref:Uncharacterized protein n=1 Tax=Cylindrotheca closterium TaxID=2856 RepID=A0AAD2JJK1_9STRA|nr:unnamed protein product [Cylindrotheca closterium]